MDEFLSSLVAWLADQNIVPPELKPSDTNKEKTYLVDMPANPVNVVVFNNYKTSIASLTPKQVGVKRIQVLVRNKSQKAAYLQIHKIYQFLLNRPEFIEYITPTQWVIFDVKEGPIKLLQDDKGSHIWSLSFPVKTNLF